MNGPRYELKFLISAEEKERFLEASGEYLERDPHCLDSDYRVSSLYFDFSDLRAYWEKLDGEERRSKYRLRFYSHGPQGEIDLQSAFMEIKHRINNTIFKERVKLTASGAEAILSGSERLSSIEKGLEEGTKMGHGTILKIIRADSSGRGLLPVNIITYLREAWMGKYQERLRVTFDSFLEAHRPLSHEQVNSGMGQVLLPPARFILEVKFNHSIPRWIRDLIGSHGIILRRFSKYAAGVEAPGILPASRAPGRLHLSRLIHEPVERVVAGRQGPVEEPTVEEVPQESELVLTQASRP